MASKEGRCQKTPSGQKKAQMFIITMIFLVGLIFSVQQLLFQYSALDLSAPFRENDIYLLENLKDVVNATIKGEQECSKFSEKMEEFRSYLKEGVPRGGYSVSLNYRLNCANWENSPPNAAPLNLTIRIVGKGSDTSSVSSFYHL